MAELSSPISGGLNIARSRVSSGIFTAGRSGRLMSPVGAVGPDPTTITLLSQNQSGLNVISSQLGRISEQMVDFGGALERIAVGIANDSLFDRQKELQKQNQERILAEQKLREGKESVIERKIQGALLKPVQTIGQKAQFTLSRLMGFFTTLLSGWLLNQGIETIQALSEGNTKKLEQIRDTVLKNLGIIGGIFLAVKTGLFGLIGIAGRITSKIAGGVIRGIFVKPFQSLINAVRGTAAPAAAAASRSGGGIMNGISRGVKNIGGRLLGPAVTGAALTGLDIAGGEEPGRAIAGAAGGMIASTGAFVLGSAIPLPGTGLLAGGLAYGPGQDVGKDIYDKFFGKPEGDKKTSPMTKMMPSAENLQMGQNKEASRQDFSQSPEFGRVNIDVSGSSGEEKTTGVSAGQITPPSESAVVAPVQATIAPLKIADSQVKQEKVGPLPEPSPTIIMPPPAPQISQPPSIPSGSSRPANSTPTFSTSNPDNFYVLYSQVHYNVVM